MTTTMHHQSTKSVRSVSSTSRPQRDSAAPRVLQVRAGRGSYADVLHLQRLAGNQAVVGEVVRLQQAVGYGSCSAPSVECTASASRDATKAINGKTPTSKPNKGGGVTYKGTATLTAQYTSSAVISLASPPSGLSDCATAKYKTMIKTKLHPHEEDHKRRFATADPKHSYNGSFAKTLTESGDSAEAVQSALDAKLAAAYDTETSDRVTRNDAFAITAIDPFSVSTDISDCPECKSSDDE